MVVIQRPCLKCGALIPSGSYCGRCQPNYAPQRLRGRKWMRKRSAVLREAGYVCQRCGDRVAEEIHHVDGDPGNNRFENLLAVCVRCHRKLEAEKRAG
jgi:5-methylcytosine-specific restriction endonuclease McrA